MRSKGFTLIELLAVIVILAIIALIAVPIVLNIINNSKEESVKISAEHYFDAVEQAIAREYLKDSQVNLDGEYEIIEKGKKIKLEEREINIEYDGEGVEAGTIVIGNGKVKQAQDVKINNYYVTLESGKITSSKNESSGGNGEESGDPGSTICTLAQNGDVAPTGISVGDKYKCTVSSQQENNEFMFYVLSLDKDGYDTVSLIMDRNICDNGALAVDDSCICGWDASNEISNGPRTAIEYLNKATKNWDKITFKYPDYNDSNGLFPQFAIEGKARLPYPSEVDNVNDSNKFLYDYLDHTYWDSSDSGTGQPPENSVSKMFGYWTFHASSPNFSWYIDGSGWYSGTGGPDGTGWVEGGAGIRPVITIDKDSL